MPSTQFKFVLSNTTVGYLDVPSSRVIGRALGFTQVSLVDNSILLNILIGIVNGIK